jgi:hypothetical protein
VVESCWSTPSSNDSLSRTSPLGDALDVFVRLEDAERLIEGVRRDDPELAKPLRIEERKLEANAGGRNERPHRPKNHREIS